MVTNMMHPTDSQVTAARSLLLSYQHPTTSALTQAQIRQALLTLLPAIDYVMLGICAHHWDEGILTLQQYSHALDLPQLLPTPALTGAVYIKFNPRQPKCYASEYQGSDRGVLVAAQSDDLTKLNEMFGHLPLDLFAEV
jgi:Domain of unknown function (DUF1824)